MNPSVSFKTVGCRLNQAETASMAGHFKAVGYDVVPFGSPSSVTVIHTCTVTANAERECVRLARSVKRKHPDAFVVLAGCAVESSADRLIQEPAIDLLANQRQKLSLPELIRDTLSTSPLQALRSKLPAP